MFRNAANVNPLFDQEREKILDCLYFLTDNFHSKYDLSKARLQKMLYLADWRSAYLHKRQITSISWVFNHYGPYVNQVANIIKESKDVFRIEENSTILGNFRETISIQSDCQRELKLTQEEKNILLDILDITSDLNWAQFISLIYATDPVKYVTIQVHGATKYFA